MAKSSVEERLEAAQAELLEKDHQAFLRMAMVAVAANLWNSSLGRNEERVAVCAWRAAEALWQQWLKGQKK